MDTTSNEWTVLPPNHHAHHPGFSGLSGWIAALGFRTGRNGDAELAIRLTTLAAGDRVVDIGCGPGVAARLAAERGATVTGVDPADVMLRVARRDDKGGHVTWRPGVAETLPLPDRSQNVAWSLSTVHHWRALEAGLSEVRRVLATDGRFLVTERQVRAGATGHASHGWTFQQAQTFADMCTAAGFRDVDVSSHNTERGVLLAVLAHASASM